MTHLKDDDCCRLALKLSKQSIRLLLFWGFITSKKCFRAAHFTMALQTIRHKDQWNLVWLIVGKFRVLCRKYKKTVRWKLKIYINLWLLLAKTMHICNHWLVIIWPIFGVCFACCVQYEMKLSIFVYTWNVLRNFVRARRQWKRYVRCSYFTFNCRWKPYYAARHSHGNLILSKSLCRWVQNAIIFPFAFNISRSTRYANL